MDKSICVGRVCCSKAGRDKGRNFIVFSVENEDYVRIVDGDTRKIENPKRKKLKHLVLQKTVLKEIGEQIAAGRYLLDADIRKALDQLKQTP